MEGTVLMECSCIKITEIDRKIKELRNYLIDLQNDKPKGDIPLDEENDICDTLPLICKTNENINQLYEERSKVIQECPHSLDNQCGCVLTSHLVEIC
jgi:hypothetical protein